MQVPERKPLKVPNILKVIYAPHKAFKEVAENPSYLGPLIVLLIIILANAGFAYVYTSKTFVEQTVPDIGTSSDEWTQDPTFWTSNAKITESSDVVNGTPYLSFGFYGNESIEFSLDNSSEIFAALKSIGTVNCSNPDGYYKLSFKVKWTDPAASPLNVSIQLFSANSSNNFYKNLEPDFVNSTYNTWINETIILDTGEWSSSNPSATDWRSITSVTMNFTWIENSNTTLLIDGLYFHGPFKPLIEAYGTPYLLNLALSVVMQFVISWVILSGLIYVMAKSFGGNLIWKALLVAIGLALITMFVQTIVNLGTYSTISAVKYPFEVISGFRGEPLADTSFNAILDQTWLADTIGRYVQIAVYVWTIALSSIALRTLSGFSWIKSILIGAVAYVITLLAGSFLFG